MKCLGLVAGCVGLILGSLLWAAEPRTVPAVALPSAAGGVMDFRRDIRPILAQKCITCHNTDKQRGGLRLDDGPAALKGGNSGAVLKPGAAVESRLFRMVAGLDTERQMPPKGRPQLTAEEKGRLRAWIDQGARWPQEPAATVASTPKSRHWAYIAPKRPNFPKVTNAAWVRNPIDAFVLARLEAEKVQSSPEADRVTLIRRLSLDLLGLPPTPEEVDAFVNDTRPGAYERLVDRLLASPHYGERWARHWLDLARYADSDGFEKDTGRPFAWRWRNWVIEALNRDLPFDQFTIEQLAGDLLPGATVDQKVATGFHRNTLTNREGGVDREQFRVEAVVDRVNTTGKVFLGQTIGCAQCHDHKYDPFSQREYYQLFAFFNSDVELDVPAPVPGDDAIYRKAKAAFDQKKAELQAAVTVYTRDLLPRALEKWENGLKEPERKQLPAAIVAILNVPATERTAQQQKQLADHYAKSDARLLALTKAVTAHDRTAPKPTMAQTLALGKPRPTHVMIRGDFLRPGVEVEPGTPAVLPAVPGGTKTRLDLARWIVSPSNPLTARVIMNWLWLHHFGRGIVATQEDFGTQGDKPSHPELLDYLATQLVDQAWSMKAMHRLIVTSATYRQSARTRPELVARDPLNILLARQTRVRLEAEVLRDAALASSGLLTRTVGGPSVRPPQPAGISELTYANSVRWVESTGADRYRRGLYIWFQRTSPYPMLMTFDAPDSNVCCVRRERANTPLQALTLLNDTVFVECAQALGRRLMEDRAGGTDERLRYGFRLCVSREPTETEQAVLRRLFDSLLDSCRANPDEAMKLVGGMKPDRADVPESAAWIGVARALLNLDEFMTRE